MRSTRVTRNKVTVRHGVLNNAWHLAVFGHRGHWQAAWVLRLLYVRMAAPPGARLVSWRGRGTPTEGRTARDGRRSRSLGVRVGWPAAAVVYKRVDWLRGAMRLDF